ncbi:hypothetical protein WN944_001852 [Citrus x changshan-huyou]|uniref:RRM domain-containing protein n=1 Tax=Citrus x changshan-huyou TaxID=2935761 RepID=A0AAP0QRM0_9ROSI
MALRAAVAAPRGLRRLFSTSPFSSSLNPPQRPQADPSTNLFVSGLSKRTTDETLRETFSAFGEVVHAKIVKHRESGYSKGFGFVKYATLEAAGKAIEGMDGKFLDGWVIFVEYAKPRQPPTLPSQNNTNFQYGRQ